MPLDVVVFGTAIADALGASVAGGDAASAGVDVGVADGTGVVTETPLDACGTGVGVGCGVGLGVAGVKARTTTVPRIPSAAQLLSGQ